MPDEWRWDVLTAAHANPHAFDKLVTETPQQQVATGASFSVTSISGDGIQLSDRVLSGSKWATLNLTFSFPDSYLDYEYDDYTNASGVNQFAPLNAAQKQAAYYALGLISQYTGVVFTEVTGTADWNADIRFAVGGAPSTAWAYYPSTNVAGGDVWFNPTSYNSPSMGNYAFSTFMHELGHAMGLKHGQDTSFAGALPYDYNSHEYSLMTYMSYVGSSGQYYTNPSDGGPQTYMMADIGALQTMYGANFGLNATATRYTFDTTTGQMSVNGVGQGDPNGNTIFRTIWDGGGVDTYDFSNFATAMKVDLAPGSYSDLAVGLLTWRADLGGTDADFNKGYSRGHVFNTDLYKGDVRSLIENAVAGSGNDTVSGNQAANQLDGGAGSDSIAGLVGNDTLIGGAGDDVVDGGDDIDTFLLNLLSTSVSVAYDSVTGWFSLLSSLGADRVTNVEYFTFSDVTMTAAELSGVKDEIAPTLVSTSPADGRTGVQVSSNLVLTFSEQVTIGAGTIVISDGLSDVRTIDVTDASQVSVSGATVTINPTADLAFGKAYSVTASAGAFTDLANNAFAGITDTSVFNFSTASGLSVTGTAGNDSLVGSAGADTMSGGAGNDTYIVDNPGDVVIEASGSGTDTARASVSYMLAANVETLVLTGSNAINGTGNALANAITGNGASNVIKGGGGRDQLTGGAGADIFTFTALGDSGVGTSKRDTITDFVSGLDRIDLSAIDAKSATLGDDAFSSLVTGAFTKVAGQLRYASGVVQGDVNGDGKADFEIALSGNPALKITDFIL